MSAFRLGVLISGGGTTFLNLHERIRTGDLAAEIACVVSSKSGAAGLTRARDLGYAHTAITRKAYPDDRLYSQAVTDYLISHRVDLVVLAGFLRKYLPGEPFRERCVNIHPSLIPAFCGKGFYGMKVHEAVWRRSCKVTGCTVHLVNDVYDDGPIILQRTVAVNHEDTPETIQKKVFEKECEAYPEAIRLFIEHRIRFENGRSLIDPPDRGR